MAERFMKVLIYGAGAVGLGAASCLLKSGARVDIVARPDTVEALRRDGLLRRGIFGDFSAASGDFGCHASLDVLPRQVYDDILVCTKSFDSEAAAQEICRHKGCYDASTRIVLFQNGWGNAEIFAQHFPTEQIFNARVITGFTRPKPNEVLVTVHADAIHIGSLFGAAAGRVNELCAAIAAGGIPCKPTEAIEKDLWAKMLYNCALNPLGAILNVPYGDLAAYASTRFIMDQLVMEIYRVMAESGYQTHWSRPQDFLNAFYSKLVPNTARHKSSMLQDLSAGKKTEIDALNGAVINLAQTYHIDVPYNQSVYHIINFRQRHG